MNKLFAINLAVEVYQLSLKVKFPTHLKDQYFRACSSIALNLSEGNAKPTVADRRKFFFVALGSVRESQTILLLQGLEQSELGKRMDFLGVCVYRLCQALK